MSEVAWLRERSTLCRRTRQLRRRHRLTATCANGRRQQSTLMMGDYTVEITMNRTVWKLLHLCNNSVVLLYRQTDGRTDWRTDSWALRQSVAANSKLKTQNWLEFTQSVCLSVGVVATWQVDTVAALQKKIRKRQAGQEWIGDFYFFCPLGLWCAVWPVTTHYAPPLHP